MQKQLIDQCLAIFIIILKFYWIHMQYLLCLQRKHNDIIKQHLLFLDKYDIIHSLQYLSFESDFELIRY